MNPYNFNTNMVFTPFGVKVVVIKPDGFTVTWTADNLAVATARIAVIIEDSIASHKKTGYW